MPDLNGYKAHQVVLLKANFADGSELECEGTICHITSAHIYVRSPMIPDLPHFPVTAAPVVTYLSFSMREHVTVQITGIKPEPIVEAAAEEPVLEQAHVGEAVES